MNRKQRRLSQIPRPARKPVIQEAVGEEELEEVQEVMPNIRDNGASTGEEEQQSDREKKQLIVQVFNLRSQVHNLQEQNAQLLLQVAQLNRALLQRDINANMDWIQEDGFLKQVGPQQ